MTESQHEDLMIMLRSIERQLSELKTPRQTDTLDRVQWESRARDLDAILKMIFRWSREKSSEDLRHLILGVWVKAGHLLLEGSPLRETEVLK